MEYGPCLNSFIGMLSSKFAINWLLNITQNLQRISKLLCEYWYSKAEINNMQDSVAARSRFCGIFNHDFKIAKLLLNMPVKEFWILVNILMKLIILYYILYFSLGNLCRCTGYRPILEGFRRLTKVSNFLVASHCWQWLTLLVLLLFFFLYLR